MKTDYFFLYLLIFTVGISNVSADDAIPLSVLYALPDPTRPPALLSSNAMKNTDVGTEGGSSNQAVVDPASGKSISPNTANTPESPNQLVLMRIDTKTGRALAMIGTQMVGVGDRIGDSIVTAIDVNGVKMKNPQGSQYLSFLQTHPPSTKVAQVGMTSNDKAEP